LSEFWLTVSLLDHQEALPSLLGADTEEEWVENLANAFVAISV